jgi:hypothetical protein
MISMTHRRIAALAVLTLAGALPAPAQAAAGALDPVFANTVEVTYPDGRMARLWVDRDGSYRGQNRQGRPSSGRWTIKAAKLCLKQKRPFAAPMSYCTPIVTGGVGASWLGKAVTGETVRIRLVAGR